jgi:tetratricopeptide (TPR) repeat protein
MTNPATTKSQRVRFEEVTPTNEIVAYFDTQLPDLVAGKGLPIFPGYDDLDDIQFVYITLPSGNTVVLGQYGNAPEIGVDLYVELDRKNNSTAITTNIPALVVETLRYLAIPRETAVWFHPDYETEIELLYAKDVEFESIPKSPTEELALSTEYEPIDCFYHALEIYTRPKFPEHWAMLQHNLGLAYFDRIKGERWENLQKSIECFHKSLEVFTKDKFPKKWQINFEDLTQSLEAFPNIKLTIEFNDPELEPAQRDEQAQFLIDELKDIDKIDIVDRVLDPTAPTVGTKAIGGFLTGLLMAEVKVDNAKKLFGYLRDRLSGKSIELTVEANGKKLTIKASSCEEFDYAITKANDLIDRGAIFEDASGDRSESRSLVPR